MNYSRGISAPQHNGDLLAEAFTAQAERPPGLRDLNPEALAPFQRALLAMDGTVTRFLEAYALEPIEIVTLGESKRTVSQAHQWLDLAVGQGVVSRHALLRGQMSHRTYTAAVSLVVPERMSIAVPYELGSVSEGLGRMLSKQRMAHYRELLWYGKDTSMSLPANMRGIYRGELATRTYRIFVKDRPAIMITEWFPLSGE